MASKASTDIAQDATALLLQVRDVFLFQGDGYGPLFFYVALAGFCTASLRTILLAKPSINFSHGLALGVLTSFGGSTLCAIMCGAPASLVVNEALVTTLLAVWVVLFLFKASIMPLLETPAGRLFMSVTYETMRCHVMMGSAALAAKELGGSRAAAYALRTSVATVAPLVGGILGGCGGGFMPLDKGLGPIEAGMNWRIGSAALGSIWLQLTLRDPDGKAYVASLVPALASADWIRFGAVAFFVLAPMLGLATQFGPNPLAPFAPPAAAPPAKAAKGKKTD